MLALNLPNNLTLLRMILVPIFVLLLVRDDFEWALFVFLAAGITDGIDGFIARHWNQQTELGALLDPIADKFLLISAFVTLALARGPVPVPLWLAFATVARDLILLLSGVAFWLHGSRREFRPSWGGKATTVLQIVFVAVALLDNARGEESVWFLPLALMTLAATLGSGLHYLLRSHRDAPQPPPQDRS